MMSKLYDAVDRPFHYTCGDIECIDAMIASKGLAAVIAFCECNAFKYTWRAGKKGEAAEDWKKAVWYLNKAVELRKRIADEAAEAPEE